MLIISLKLLTLCVSETRHLRTLVRKILNGTWKHTLYNEESKSASFLHYITEKYKSTVIWRKYYKKKWKYYLKIVTFDVVVNVNCQQLRMRISTCSRFSRLAEDVYISFEKVASGLRNARCFIVKNSRIRRARSAYGG